MRQVWSHQTHGEDNKKDSAFSLKWSRDSFGFGEEIYQKKGLFGQSLSDPWVFFVLEDFHVCFKEFPTLFFKSPVSSDSQQLLACRVWLGDQV